MAKQSALIGTGFAEACKEAGRILREDHEKNFEADQNRVAEAEAKSYQGAHEYFLLVKRHPETGHVKVQTIEEFPLVGRLAAVGRSYEAALAELRMGYATELVEKGLMPHIDDARRYATRCNFRVSLGDL